MNKFITGDIWKEVNENLEETIPKVACIAYVTSTSLNLTENDILICDASDFSIKFGETSAKTIKFYHEKGVKIYSNQDLHSKLLLTDNFLVIGSANLSKNSAENLVESAVLTNDPILLSQTKAFCHNLILESDFLNSDKINELLEIEVIKRPFKPTTKSKTREKEFGDKYWFVSVFPLKDRTYEKIKDTVERTTKDISELTKIDEEDISFLRWRNQTQFSTQAQEGDQVILKWTNDEKTRSYVYAPVTILRKEIENGFTYLYYNDSNSENNKVSWTKFQSFTKTLTLEKNTTTRSKLLSVNDINKIRVLWSDN